MSSINIRISPARKSDPPGLVAEALESLNAENYDQAFCVFDRDSHPGFDRALDQIAQSAAGQAGKFKAIVSWPCFEVWVLLHFVMTTKAFTAIGGRSPCQQVISEIVAHFPGYFKSFDGLFEALADKLETALRHAQHLSAHNFSTRTRNPSTDVHTLVAYLRRLKSQAPL